MMALAAEGQVDDSTPAGDAALAAVDYGQAALQIVGLQIVGKGEIWLCTDPADHAPKLTQP
jgi:hypothetical protein